MNGISDAAGRRMAYLEEPEDPNPPAPRALQVLLSLVHSRSTPRALT